LLSVPPAITVAAVVFTAAAATIVSVVATAIAVTIAAIVALMLLRWRSCCTALSSFHRAGWL
jgi:hypothetical protein